MGRETYSQYISRLATERMVREMAALPEERRTDRFGGRVVDFWHTRLARGATLLFIPTIGAAIRAQRPWLSYACPACTMIGEADLRKIDRHPGASIESLVPELNCPRCPNGPFVKLLGLHDMPGR